MRSLLLIFCMLSLTACDSPAVPKNVPQVDIAPTSKDGLFAEQRQTLDKAKQLNQSTQTDAEAQRRAIEQQSQ